MREDLTTFDDPNPPLKQPSSPPELESSFHICSTCGLKLPISITSCPNDGTFLANLVVDKLAEQYEFLEEIGSGGIGIVYKARHRLLNQIVAIKTLRANSMNQASQKRFEQEAKLISSLDHRGIVRLRDFGTTESGQLHMVLDYVAGQSLAEAVNWHGTFSIADSLEIIIQICDAMQYAHKNSILHRDIKPSNIMFERTESGLEIKVLDFGIAKVLDLTASESASLTKTGEIFGSPLYMSPEQALGKKLDERSDIYSLGIVMYEILSGSPPFAGLNVIDTISNQISRQVPALSTVDKSIPPEIDAVVSKALAKSPEDRFQSMSDFKRALLDVKSGKKNLILNTTDEKQNQKLNTKKFELKIIIVSTCIILLSIGFLIMLVTRKEEISATDKALSNISAVYDTDTIIGTVSAKKTATADATAKELIQRHIGDKFVDLSNLLLSDSGLSPFKECKVTEQIRFRGDTLTGPGLAYLIHLPLRQLDLYGTSITDRSLSEIKNMKHLQELNLSHTDITDAGLDQLVGLPQLKRLSLKSVPVSDRGIDALAKIKKLECLNLKYNASITAKGMEKLANMPVLRELRIRKSHIIGDLQLIGLKSSKNIKILDLKEDPNVTDKTISNLLKTNIEQLNISETQVTGKGLLVLKNMPSLKFLVAGNNIGLSDREKLHKERPDITFIDRMSEDLDQF
jgi:serine/threonine-protein kinase